MPKLINRCLLIASLLAVSISAGRSAENTGGGAGEAVPLESFFAEPEMRSVQLAPDGKHLAFLAKLGTGRIGVALMNLETGKVEPLVAAKDENYAMFFWKGSDRIVFGGDIGGRESLSLRAINLTSRNVIVLAEAFKELVADMANQAAIVDRLPLDPGHLLIQGNKEVGSWDVSIYMLNVRTGDRTKQPGADDTGVSQVVADTTGVIRGRDRLESGKFIHEVRAGASTGFYKVGESDAQAAIAQPTWLPLEFNADNNILYVITRKPGEDSSSLRAYDTKKRAYLPEIDLPIEGTFDHLVMSNDRTKLLGVYYLTDRLHVHWFDQARAKLQASIDAALPGTFNMITSSSDDGKVHVIVARSDRDPGTYYILDRQNPARGKPAIMKLGRINSKIDPDKMQPMQSISYKSRDGLTIHGYLTLPAGANGKRVPLIINPHGGPYGIRDEWGFNDEVQFLASRGYAVLQPNYRGSGGYGAAFQLAGRKEWGGKMQDDLTDGVKWAVDQGIADPARVAIVGASYGGYAALAGVTFTPDLYCCAVNYVGVSDLSIITSHARIQSSERLFQEGWIGDDKDYLYNRSPVNFVQNIRVPTLHAYGDNDPRVDIDNWKRLKSKLDYYHKPYEFLREAEQGHGFRNEDARITFYRQVDTFLAKYLRPVPEGKVDVKDTQIIAMPAGSDH